MVFEFFVAVLGIAFFTAKFGAEKLRKSETDKRNTACRASQTAWMSRWTDQNLERELREYISDCQNYDRVYSEIAPTMAEIPILREYAGFGSTWEECGIYPPYWRQRGLSKKTAITQAYAVQTHVVDTMLAARGKAPYNWSYYRFGSCVSGCPAPVELAIFQWCVKKLRAYGMNDAVVRISRGGESLTPGWTYTLQPLANESYYSEVTDDEIVMMPK